MTVVLDASAVLAFLQDEPGAALVEEALVDGASCGAANWSELAQKVLGRGRDWDLVGALLDTYAVDVTPVVRADAEWAARRWLRGEGLSLADRLCLGLAARLDTPVLTADAQWGSKDQIMQIR